jgi:hypothetical protein
VNLSVVSVVNNANRKTEAPALSRAGGLCLTSGRRWSDAGALGYLALVPPVASTFALELGGITGAKPGSRMHSGPLGVLSVPAKQVNQANQANQDRSFGSEGGP